MRGMLALFTDFGVADPYVGQLHAVLAQAAPDVPVIDLFHAVPAFDVRAGAYLLPALARTFPPGTIFVAVVDPGVGGERAPLMLEADGHWYVGPDNGLFTLVARRARQARALVIDWRPERLSASFHGRDLFAPVAARLARGEMPPHHVAPLTIPAGDWPDDWPRVLTIDHYGNAITGLRACALDPAATVVVAGQRLRHARVFAGVAPGAAFWYENSSGLVEIAVNQGHAAQRLGITLGAPVEVE
jgi:hypothetical protein